VLGGIYMYPNPPKLDHARDAYRQGLALAEELHMRPLEAQCYLAFGHLDGQGGNLEKAHSHLIRASTMLREMGMQFWLEKADSALAEL